MAFASISIAPVRHSRRVTVEAVVVTVTERPWQEARDRGTAAATRDPRVGATVDEEPVFDGRRLIAGRLETVLRHPDDA
ncbi:hypothetical protein [Streptomyces sp. NPDC060194]|uniref:hypothetical protein n=1 Tax=Streptomyces sp. NPDC060194 TaxID=3347069 RepID=UPI0036658CBC